MYDRSCTHKTTFNAGQLIPIFVDEYIPGDTFVMDTSVLARMSTPIFPVMDQAFLDLYYFAVPYRLVWDNWKAFMGESPRILMLILLIILFLSLKTLALVKAM